MEKVIHFPKCDRFRTPDDGQIPVT